MTIQPWRAASVQVLSDLAVLGSTREEAWSIIQRNIDRGVALIEAECRGPNAPKLFVMPEFSVQGPPHDLPVEPWIEKVCCPIPGAITAPFQQLAKKHGIYIGGNQFESAEDWPGRYFNTCFLIDPNGEVILRYRRITTAAFPSPHDFMDDYLSRYSLAEVFPVVETELGRIAMIPCSEISVPEVSRVMMMQGAEVILHPTNGKRIVGEEAAKVARCYENKFYMISANVAGPIGFSRDRKTLGGRSRIVDFEGQLLAYHEPANETTCVQAMIDIEALRRNRAEDEGPSGLLRARWEMYAPFFAKASFYPPNAFLQQPMKDVAETAAALDAARENFRRAGLLPKT